MTIFKSPEYLGLRICNVDDSKVIDLICTRSKLIWQSESNEYLNETQKTNNVAQRRQTTKSHLDDKITKEKNKIDVKITYFNKREIEKRVRGVILGQKLTLNHPSLMHEEEETKVLVTAHIEGVRERFWFL